MAGAERSRDRLLPGCACGARTTLTRDDLILLLGGDAPLDLIGLRLRCARCGQQPWGARFEWAAEDKDGADRDHGAR